MMDTTIARMAEEVAAGLKHVDGEMEFKRLVPIYNGLVTAAQANHPQDPFLSMITSIDANRGEEYISAAEMRILFGLLRLALESLQNPTKTEESERR